MCVFDGDGFLSFFPFLIALWKIKTKCKKPIRQTNGFEPDRLHLQHEADVPRVANVWLCQLGHRKKKNWDSSGHSLSQQTHFNTRSDELSPFFFLSMHSLHTEVLTKSEIFEARWISKVPQSVSLAFPAQQTSSTVAAPWGACTHQQCVGIRKTVWADGLCHLAEWTFALWQYGQYDEFHLSGEATFRPIPPRITCLL